MCLDRRAAPETRASQADGGRYDRPMDPLKEHPLEKDPLEKHPIEEHPIEEHPLGRNHDFRALLSTQGGWKSAAGR